MSIMVGVGRGAQAGVLIKNAEALERLEKVDTLVVDKTGTLTEGRPKVVAIVPARGLRGRRACCAWPPAWSGPASIRWPRRSSRGGRAQACAGRGRGLRLADRQGRARHGRGPQAGARQCRRSCASSASTRRPLEAAAERLRAEGATAIFVGVDGRLPASSPSPTRSRRRRPTALAALRAGRACAS